MITYRIPPNAESHNPALFDPIRRQLIYLAAYSAIERGENYLDLAVKKFLPPSFDLNYSDEKWINYFPELKFLIGCPSTNPDYIIIMISQFSDYQEERAELILNLLSFAVTLTEDQDFQNEFVNG